ncbi:MAG: CmpA/NrtA family ABC transporter substrate-binding protein [Pseudomonadota bacterium]
MTNHQLSAGFIPLIDAAPLIVASAKGFAEEQGIDLKLKRSNSWAGLRDRLSVGDVDAAHMLAPVVVASQLNIGNPKAPMIAPCGLSMNGNAISVSNGLFEAMQATGWTSARDPAAAANAVAKVLRRRRGAGQDALTFATVYPFSSHTYELRYWLASARIDPDEDINLTVVPPPMIVDALKEGHIDGFCVGAPWSGLGAESGRSHVIAYKADIWPQGPEKVLAVRETWAHTHPELVSKLVRMLIDSAAWCALPGNAEELAQILSGTKHLDLRPQTILGSLSGRVIATEAEPVRNHLLFDPAIASYPWRSHALWFYAQMVRWGQVDYSEPLARAAKKAYRPDLYRRAFDDRGVADDITSDHADSRIMPGNIDSAAAKVRLFDDRLFDPDDLDGYFAGLEASLHS